MVELGEDFAAAFQMQVVRLGGSGGLLRLVSQIAGGPGELLLIHQRLRRALAEILGEDLNLQ